MSIRMSFAQACRATRIRLDITQQALAATLGVSRGYIANIETGRANPSLDQAERIADALGLQLELVTRPPRFIAERRSGDLVHARCSSYVDRRLRALGWLTAREVEIADHGTHGWIDLLAFDPRTGILLIIELKTRLDDIGAVERQLRWYGRRAPLRAAGLGWQPRRIGTWLLALASDEVEASLRIHRDLIAVSFPDRAPDMGAVARRQRIDVRPGLALIDPASRRREWLLRTRLDGRRSGSPYAGLCRCRDPAGPPVRVGTSRLVSRGRPGSGPLLPRRRDAIRR